MAELTKTKVIDIQTGSATKNVDNLTKSFVPLKRQIKELKDEMGQLTKGTKEYDEAALKLADLQQKQVEIAEAAKYSNKDFGAVMSNLTKVSVGLVGGINAISASMAMLSSDSEEVQKALGKIQLVMAVIQGFSALDTALKSVKGLFNAFGGVATEAETAAVSMGELQAELNTIGDKTVNVSVEADASTVETVKRDIEEISDKSVDIEIDADTDGVDRVKSELSSLKDEKVDIGIDTTDATIKTAEVKTELETIGDESVSISVDNTEAVAATETTRAEIESIPDTHNTDITVNTGEAVPHIEVVRAEIESIPDTKTINIEDGGVGDVTDKVKDLSKAEGEAAKTANTLGKANNTITKTSKGVVGGLKAIALGLKNAAKAMIQFIASNPILAAIAATIAAVAGGIALLNKRMEEQGRVAKEEANILSDVNNQYQEQTIRLNVLLKTAKDQNSSLEERKKAVEELNKIVPEYNAHINETTGAYEANNEALETYMNNLKQKLLLEAYEGKIKEYLEKQLELEEEINEIENTGWFATKKRIRNRKEEIADIEKDINRIYNKIGDLDLGSALADNKVVTNTKKTTNTVKQQIKSIADAIKELKKIVVDLWDTFYNESLRKFTGPVDSFRDMKNEIQKIMHQSDLSSIIVDSTGNTGYKAAQIFTTQFADFLKNGSKSIWSDFSSGFNADRVFNPQTIKRIQELRNQAGQYAANIDILIQSYDKLADKQGGKLTDAQTKQFEEQKKGFETNLKSINDELKAYDQILESVKVYSDQQAEVRKSEDESALATVKHNQQLKIEKQYFDQLKAGNPMADADKNLATMRNELDYTVRYNDMLKNRLTILQTNSKGNELYTKEIKELQDQIAENEKSIQDQQLQIDITSYNNRLQEAENYFATIERMTSDQMNQVTIDNGGKDTGSSELEKQQIEVNAIKEKIELVKQMYEQGLITQAEYNSRSLELSAQLAQAEQAINQQRVSNFVNTTGQIVDVFSAMSGAVTAVLQEMMESMDEGSEEYKRLALTTAIIQTLSGTLGAFMSGVNSGIPAPYNLILAAVMAASTAAVGAIQIAKIKQGTDSTGGAGGMSSAAASVGQSTYETTAYQQQTELLGNVADTRVYVLEHDISNSQNNVRVREQNTTF